MFPDAAGGCHRLGRQRRVGELAQDNILRTLKMGGADDGGRPAVDLGMSVKRQQLDQMPAKNLGCGGVRRYGMGAAHRLGKQPAQSLAPVKKRGAQPFSQRAARNLHHQQIVAGLTGKAIGFIPVSDDKAARRAGDVAARLAKQDRHPFVTGGLGAQPRQRDTTGAAPL